MLRRHLPPLNALPSFEAAARHLSFSRAADELHLTQIGASFAAEVRGVLEHLASATSAATGQSSGIVSVSTIDSFAARWLMPRLFRFRRVHGDIDVRVAISERL